MINSNKIEYILGIQIRHNCTIYILILSQVKYVLNTLNLFFMNNCYAISTLFEASIHFFQGPNLKEGGGEPLNLWYLFYMHTLLKVYNTLSLVLGMT